MKVLIFYPRRLPPKDYGGIERFVLWLSKALVELGHEVWVAAQRGSLLASGVRLVSLEKHQTSLQGLFHNRIFTEVLEKVDLLHLMAPLPKENWQKIPLPVLFTVHGNGKPGEVFHPNSVFLSQNHAFRHRSQIFVYNGIDPSEYAFDPQSKKEWFLFLSKTSWRVKNLRGAMQLCKKAKVPLHIAGGQGPFFHRFLANFSRNYHWVGPTQGNAKSQLLTQARALIFPVLWEEPFGLVVAEALMSGTPVLATKRGSLPELVSPEVGAILDTNEQWIEALSRPKLPWDPMECRNRAMEKFHFRKMASEYLMLYKKVSQGVPL